MEAPPNQTFKSRYDKNPGSLFAVRVAVSLVLTAAIAFMAGVWFANATDSPHNNSDFKVFWQSWDILEDDYYFELPEDQDLVYGAIYGLLATTGDPYTIFVPPGPAEFDRQRTAGEYGGIGAFISRTQGGQIVISNPFAGLPADEAGLKTGDVLLSVDGTSVEDWPVDDVVVLLRGDIGSQVTLNLYRPSEDERFSVEITRARVELPTVSADRFGDVGYVRLFSFNERATAALDEEITTLLDEGIRALILDLRNNPGGLLDQAVGVSDLFLGDGVVVTQRNRDGDEIRYESVDGQHAESVPLVVLIDGGSASASEVVAGALQDRDRASLIGQPSFGKGAVQHVYDMSDDSQLHVTTAVWFTPDETLIAGQGLEPDIEVSEEAGLPDETDPFIQAALTFFEQNEEED